MDKEELKSYLFRNGWRDTKWLPESYKGRSLIYKFWIDAGKPESGIYEKEPIPIRRLKLLKTSIRLEIRVGRKWIRFGSIHYSDLELDTETDKLCASTNIESRSLHEQTTIH